MSRPKKWDKGISKGDLKERNARREEVDAKLREEMFERGPCLGDEYGEGWSSFYGDGCEVQWKEWFFGRTRSGNHNVLPTRTYKWIQWNIL